MQSSELLLADVQFLLGWFVLAWLITFVELGFWRQPPGQGLPDIKAWSFSGLFGIFLAPFIHRSWRHLRGNTVPFFVLGGLVLLRHPIDFIVITLTIALVSGLLGWFFGRVAFIRNGQIYNVRYAGLSRLIFGYAGFLLALFYFDRTVASAIVLILTILLFGNRLWLMIPSKKLNRLHISWDGHLIGFIVGAFVAAYLAELRPLSIALLQALNLPTQFEGITIAGFTINEQFYRQTLPPLIAQYAPALLNRLVIVLQLVAAAWIIGFVDFQLLRGALHRNLGIRPWRLRGLIGIPLAPFLHGNWDHLSGNTLFFLIFASLIVLVRPDDFLLITIAITLISGALDWLAGQPNGNYFGASSVILGYVGFLLSLFYFENDQVSAFLLVGTLVILVLIDLIWRGLRPIDLLLFRERSFIREILPKDFKTSWSHFLGFVSGVFVAAYLPELRSYAAYLMRTFNLL